MIKIKLGDYLDVKRGASLSGEYYTKNGSLIRLTLGNFNYPGGGFKYNDSKEDIFFVGKIKDEFILNKGDIITPLTEQVEGLLGETATIPETGKFIQSGDIGLVKPNENKINKRFVYYLLASPIIKKQLSASAQQTKIRHTSPDAIKSCEAWIPDKLSTQSKIARFLDNINDKININSTIISELDSMAKLIYAYWFVQFDFPDENGRPYKSSGGKMVWNKELKREIPEGWEVGKLGDSISTERGIAYSSVNIKSGDGVPMLNLATFTPGSGKFKAEGLKHFLGKYSKNKILKPYDLILCNTQQTAIKYDTDIIGRAMLVPDIFDNNEIVFSHHVNVIRSNTENLKYYLLYLFNSNYFHRYISGFTSGTNITGLDISGINNYLIGFPPNNILILFAKIIHSFQQINNNIYIQNKMLVSLRDFLLPLLMNGQIKVSAQ